MAAIPLAESAVRTLKRGIVIRFPNDKSSHLSEALAAALGFNTNMALVDAIRRTNADDPEIRLLDESRFLDRLRTVAGRELSSGDRGLIFDSLRFVEDGQIIRTRSIGFTKVRYAKSKRRLAWRNLMVHAINAGIEQRLFTVRPGDNRWPGARKDRFDKNIPATFRFEIEGMPVVGSVHDAGYDELSIHVAAWPTNDAEYWVPVSAPVGSRAKRSRWDGSNGATVPGCKLRGRAGLPAASCAGTYISTDWPSWRSSPWATPTGEASSCDT